MKPFFEDAGSWKKFTKRFFRLRNIVGWLGNVFFFFVCSLFSQMVPRIHHKDRGGSCPTTSERRKLFGEEQRIDQTRLFFIVKVSEYLNWWFFFLRNFIYLLTRYLKLNTWEIVWILKIIRDCVNTLYIYIKKKLLCFILSFFN